MSRSSIPTLSMSSSVSESGPSAASSSSSNTKKPFDKKKWRENKYSFKAKSKTEKQYSHRIYLMIFLSSVPADRWQERRERGLQHRYNKMLKKSFGKQVKGGKNPNLEPLGSKGQEDGDGEQERPQGGNSQRRFGQKNKKCVCDMVRTLETSYW